MMKFKFYWDILHFKSKSFIRPECCLLSEIKEKPLNILGFLVDDEGLGRSHLQRWLKEGLEQIDKVARGEISEYDMWGQSLGALVTLDKVTIYWGDYEYPDNYLEFEQFRTIVSKWYEFLLGEPDLNKEVIFSV